MHNPIPPMRQAARRHPRTWLVLAVTIPVLIGCLTVVVARATADTPAPVGRVCTHNPDGTCRWSPTRTAREFRAGHYRRAHGFRMADYFAHPARSRAVFVRKIERRLAHMPPAQFVKVRDHLAAARSATCQPSDMQCWAGRVFADAAAHANCRGGRYFSVLWNTCVAPAPSHLMTVKETIVVGGVFFCGGAVVIGAVLSPLSAGATALVAGWGASSCMFTAWASMQ